METMAFNTSKPKQHGSNSANGILRSIVLSEYHHSYSDFQIHLKVLLRDQFTKVNIGLANDLFVIRRKGINFNNSGYV